MNSKKIPHILNLISVFFLDVIIEFADGDAGNEAATIIKSSHYIGLRMRWNLYFNYSLHCVIVFIGIQHKMNNRR